MVFSIQSSGGDFSETNVRDYLASLASPDVDASRMMNHIPANGDAVNLLNHQLGSPMAIYDNPGVHHLKDKPSRFKVP